MAELLADSQEPFSSGEEEFGSERISSTAPKGRNVARSFYGTTPKRKLLPPPKPSTVPKMSKKKRMASSRLILTSKDSATRGRCETSTQSMGALFRSTSAGPGKQRNSMLSECTDSPPECTNFSPELFEVEDPIEPDYAKKQDKQNQLESSLEEEPSLVQPSSEELLELVETKTQNKQKISPSRPKEGTSNETSSSDNLAHQVPQWCNELDFNSASLSTSDTPVESENEESSDSDGDMSQWSEPGRKMQKLSEYESVKEALYGVKSILMEVCEKVKKNEACLMEIKSRSSRSV